MDDPLPETQCALQLVGPREARLNNSKPVHQPGPHQIVCRVEAAGLCFSDLKLMNQFSAHPRKSAIISGIDPAVLREIPSYVPGEAAAVPGHEAVVRVCAIGEDVRRFHPGERYLVETDYRWLRTDGSNAAFGYTFEGALQEYVLMDERVIISPEGESMLIPVSNRLSASAVALVEPWACVEDAYAERQRQTRKTDGRALVVVDDPRGMPALARILRQHGVESASAFEVPGLPEGVFDDIFYPGASAETVEALFPALAPRGLLNLVLCGRRFARTVMCPVGRVHYGGIRIIGTPGCNFAESTESMPLSAEVPEGARVHIIGAGGPMGMMHVVRVLSAGVRGVSVMAGDTDDGRLDALSAVAMPVADAHGVPFRVYNPTREAPDGAFDYIALLVPSPEFVAKSVEQASAGAIINIFAGIPADVTVPIDLTAYIEKRLYFVGTSGSVLEDMKVVLAKVENGRLDTNLSVAAIGGLDGAKAGFEAIENRTLPGKVIVYPWCHGLGLVRLEELHDRLPQVAAALEDGRWTQAAETRLAEAFGYHMV